jgi:outer membrane receptor protein involved in Fe transport
MAAGGNFEFAKYTNNTYQKIFLVDSIADIRYNSVLTMCKWGAFVQAAQSFLKDKLTLSAGLRIDGNSYSESMYNPLRQLSPRLSAAYEIRPGYFLNFNTGRYYQLPPYTTLGYRMHPICSLIKKTNSGT